MTDRLYFDDSSLLRFEAIVRGTRPVIRGAADRNAAVDPGAASPADAAGAIDVELDRTAFYPEGGGQPADHGTLDGAPVIDVQERDGTIWHRVVGIEPRVGARVTGVIEPARRRDHTEQHTGQHLLSRAFIEVLGAETVSFHMGAATATIDLRAERIQDADVERVEAEAARVILEDRDVEARIVREGDKAPAGMRKEAAVPGPYRVIHIGDYDACPCGGTHVRRTSEIGSIAILGTERVKGGLTRVEFVCGGRARRDHRRRVRVMRDLVRLLSVDESELVAATARRLERQREESQRVRDLKKELLPVRADRLVAAACAAPGAGASPRVLAVLAPEEREDLVPLAQELSRRPGVTAVLACGDAGGHVAVAAEASTGRSARALLDRILARTGGKGGGSERAAQGGYPAPLRAATVLEEASRALDAGT